MKYSFINRLALGHWTIGQTNYKPNFYSILFNQMKQLMFIKQIDCDDHHHRPKCGKTFMRTRGHRSRMIVIIATISLTILMLIPQFTSAFTVTRRRIKCTDDDDCVSNAFCYERRCHCRLGYTWNLEYTTCKVLILSRIGPDGNITEYVYGE